MTHEESEASLAQLGDSLLGRLRSSRQSGKSLKAMLPRQFWRPLLSPSTLTGLGALAVISALCGTAIVYVLNGEAMMVSDRGYSLSLAAVFVLFLVIYRVTQQVLIARTSAAVEQALHRWRVRTSDKVLRLPLGAREQLTRGTLLDGLAKSYEQLSQTVVPMISGAEAGILLAVMLVYLFSLSVLAGILTVAIAGLLAVGYMNTAAAMRGAMQSAAEANTRLSRLAEELVDGFKELRLDPEKRVALRKDVDGASAGVARHRAQAAEFVSQLITSANSASFLLAATVVFVLPLVQQAGDGSLTRIVTAVLFMLGPIGALVSSTQQFAIAQFTMNVIRTFEQAVEERLGNEPPDQKISADFQTLRLANADYEHVSASGERSFAIRDLTFEVKRGQIVFITGANGSGKTTLMRVMTGLYPLQSGRITIDGQSVTAPAPQSYRNLFSAVFADYHVFARPYGLDTAGRARLEDHMRSLGIRQKFPDDLATGYAPDRLSTGQRKRLALALALAEDRPVLVLDEWAADQDPETRAKFYLDVLPALKRAGKTIIAVTHDDRYFGQADVRYHMEEGRIEVRDAS